MDERTICTLCNGNISEPTTLSCSHSFCFSCIDLYSDLNGYDKSIICCQCGSETCIPTKGIIKLKSETVRESCEREPEKQGAKPYRTCDFCQTDAICTKFCPSCKKYMCEKCNVRHGRMAATKSHIVEEYVLVVDTKPCDLCEENQSDEYCIECKQFMCNECIREFHAVQEDTKSHILIKNDLKLKYCQAHIGKLLKFYCETDKKLMCEQCKTGNHNGRQMLCERKPTDCTNTTDQEKSPSLIELKRVKENSIKIWSLGREAKFGQLYDWSTDQFVEEYMFSTDPSPQDIKVTELGHGVEIKQFDPLSLQSCFSLFGLNNKEKINILRDFSKPQGYAAFLTPDHVKTYNSQAAGFAMRRETKDEILEYIPYQLLSENMLAKLKSGKLSGTHFVAGIEWGNISALIGQEECRPTVGETGVSCYISELVAKIQDKKVLSDELKAFFRKYRMHFFRNSATDESITTPKHSKEMSEEFPTVKDVEVFYGSMDDNTCSPIRYRILPINVLINEGDENTREDNLIQKCLTNISRCYSLEEAILYFDELCRAYKELNAVSSIMKENATCLDSKLRYKNIDYMEKCKMQEKKLKETLNGIEIRNVDSITGDKISKLISESREELSLSTIQVFCNNQRENAKAKIDFWNELKKFEVVYIGEDMTVANMRSSKGMKTYNAFFFNMDEPGFDICKAEFIKTCKNTTKYLAEKSNNKLGGLSTIYCLAIDLKLNPSLVQEENVLDCNCICFYDHGSYQSCIIAEDIINFKLNNWAIYEKCDSLEEKPMERGIVTLSCPCNGEHVSKTDLSWLCPECHGSVQYDATKTVSEFFCECGRAPIGSYKFKCSSDRHGEKFLSFKEQGVSMNLSHLKPVETINVLILGETGVGKSTWINGIVNYLTHETLQEAVKSEELINLVPSTFTMTDSSLKKTKVTVGTRFGKDNNEADVSKGSSATQSPMTYYFQYSDINVRLIDTPGIGDTRGIQKDKENFNSIMKHLRNLPKLHGICILLKPNSAKLTIVFRFCISELLAHLHRDAAKNIVFCFTNARSTFYSPGDTIVPLQEMLETLKEKHNTTIEITTDTIYCLDNESFRFLCAVRQGVEFKDDQREGFDKSWDISRKETVRLFKYITTSDPHELIGTLSLNDARNIILCLAEPIAEISKNVATNLKIIDEKLAKLKEIETNKKEIKQTTEEVVNKKIQEELNTGATDKTKLETFVAELTKLKTSLESNQKKLITTSAKFAIFLKENAIVPYNDALNDYIEYQIKEQSEYVIGGGSNFVLEILMKLRETYTEEIKLLKTEMSKSAGNNAVSPTPADIYRMRDELCAMGDSGDFMKKLAEIIADSKVAMSKNNEIKFNLQSSGSRQIHSRNTDVVEYLAWIGSAIWSFGKKIRGGGKKHSKVDGDMKVEVTTSVPKSKRK